MLRYTLICFALCFCFACQKQTIDPVGTVTTTELDTVVTFGNSHTLSNNLEEASGLSIDNNGMFWINTDSGNDPELSIVNEQGNTQKTIRINGVNNNDWEDLAKDNNDNLYIGDFGNNDNERTNLAIYKVANFSQVSTNVDDIVKIEFQFEDQNQFPPSDKNMHFDVEGFIATEDNIYLFTKDRSDPFEGITKLYELPNQEGNHTAILLSTFNTSSQKKEGAITGASISPSGQQLVLLSEQRMYLFKNFTIPHFFDGTSETIDFPVERKFEGIEFTDECTIYLVNEKKYGADAQLMQMTICE